MIVSKPARRCDPAATSDDELRPARTFHVSTSVAPFQLTWTAEPRAGFGRTATAGLSAGCPVPRTPAHPAAVACFPGYRRAGRPDVRTRVSARPAWPWCRRAGPEPVT